jgi:hypothetical protein
MPEAALLLGFSTFVNGLASSEMRVTDDRR